MKCEQLKLSRLNYFNISVIFNNVTYKNSFFSPGFYSILNKLKYKWKQKINLQKLYIWFKQVYINLKYLLSSDKLIIRTIDVIHLILRSHLKEIDKFLWVSTSTQVN